MLSPERRAVLLRGLARLLESGLPPDRAVSILADSSSTADRLVVEKLGRQLAAGSTLAQSARRAGLLNDTDGAIAAAAEHAGNLEPLLDRLATSCEQRSALLRQVKARLALPAAVILLAAILAPLPGLIGQRFGVAGYLLRACSIVAVPIGVAALLLNDRVRLNLAAFISGLALPLFSQWIFDYARRNYLETLALALQSGVPAVEAIELASTTLPVRLKHGAAGSVKRHVMNGVTVADALRQARLLTADGLALANAGEQSGALDSMLTRQVAALNDLISGREQDLAAWLPRIAYILAVAAATASIFSSPLNRV